MPSRILTVEEILLSLNEQSGNVGVWGVIEDVLVIPSTLIQGPGNISIQLGRGIVVKGFLNDQTGEIRTFLAKSIDIPGRENL